MEIVCKSITPKNLIYQLTTLGLKRLLVFNILGSCLRYIIAKGLVEGLFTIVLLGENLETIYCATQIEIAKNLCTHEVDVSTYHFKFHKNVGV